LILYVLAVHTKTITLFTEVSIACCEVVMCHEFIRQQPEGVMGSYTYGHVADKKENQVLRVLD